MMPVRIFVSYSHKDAEFRRKLEVHLAALRRDGAVETFYDGDIHPGSDLDASIRRELRLAEVFVALASPEYLNSSYCYEKEYQYALRRAGRKTMHVVVAVIRPCQWKHTRMGRYKALPEDGKEVTRWGSRDQAFEDIVNGVRRVVKLAREARVDVPPAKAGGRAAPKSPRKAVRCGAKAGPPAPVPDKAPKRRGESAGDGKGQGARSGRTRTGMPSRAGSPRGRARGTPRRA